MSEIVILVEKCGLKTGNRADSDRAKKEKKEGEVHNEQDLRYSHKRKEIT